MSDKDKNKVRDIIIGCDEWRHLIQCQNEPLVQHIV